MWVIRILSGPQAGQIFPLQEGTNTIGRAPSCNIKVLNAGVSKEHAKIDALHDKIILHDMDSRNGTFVNGVQIKSQRIQPGDKILLHDTMIEFANLPDQYVAQMNNAQMGTPQPNFNPNPNFNQGGQSFPPMHGNLAHQQNPYQQPQGHSQIMGAEHLQSAPPQGEGPAVQNIKNYQEQAQNYLENVLLPGIYKLPEMLNFKWVLGCFMLTFIVSVTLLSSVPLVSILKSSIEKESQRRALTISRTLAKVNRSAIMSGLESTVSTQIAQKEPGVEAAYIINSLDGSIIAPSALVGKYPKESFIHRARLQNKEFVENINDDTVGALVPISYYNPDTGSQSVTAHAVVVYNMGSLAINDQRTLSLLIQTLFMALILGSILFYFMYKIIEHPINDLNNQIDVALKEGNTEINTTYLFPAFQKLVSNISSALVRMQNGGEEPNQNFEYDRNTEMGNVVQLIGFAAMAITAHDNNVAAVNPDFEETTGLSSNDLLYNSFESISDQALKLSVKDLVERVEETPDQMQTNELEIAGKNYELMAQAIYGTSSIAYYVIVVLPAEGES